MASSAVNPVTKLYLKCLKLDRPNIGLIWLLFAVIQITQCDSTSLSEPEETVLNISTHKDVVNKNSMLGPGPGAGSSDDDRKPLLILEIDPRSSRNNNTYTIDTTYSPIGNSTSKIPAHIIRPSCQIYLDFFSASVGNFMKCSIKNSRPLRFCGECVHEYAAVVNDYTAIIMDETKDSAGTRCRDRILNADRIQIIVQIKNFITSLWSQSHCSACFDVRKVNETTEYNKTKEVVQFQDLSNATLHCMMNVSGGVIIPMQPYKFLNFSNEVEVCRICAPFYQELNQLYMHMEEESKDKVCMDIVDSMNYTRLLWSRDFHCSQKDREIIPVLLLTFFFCILPIIFYVGTKVHGVKQERVILQQKRMRNVTSSGSVGSSGETENDTS